MDEREQNEPGQDDWMPPELVERIRVAAERDARAQVYPAKRRGKARRGLRSPPEGRFRDLSAAFAVLSFLALAAEAALRVAGPFAAAELGRVGSPASALGLLRAAASLALLLLVVSAAPLRCYRAWLLALLAASLPLAFAHSIASALHSPNETSALPPVANAIAGALFAALLSAQPWLLLGAARRGSTEKLASLFLGIALGLTALAVLLQMLARRADPAAVPALTPLRALDMAHLLFFFLLLRTWPVLSKPIFEKKFCK
jgi:hypothetical protein